MHRDGQPLVRSVCRADPPVRLSVRREDRAVADLAYVLIVIAVFALLAVVVRGLEKL